MSCVVRKTKPSFFQNTLMKKNGEFTVILFLILFFFLVFFVRNPRMLFIIALAMLVIGGIGYFIKQGINSRKRKNYEKTYAGNIDTKIQHAENQISKHQHEMEEIHKNIADLKARLRNSPDLKQAMVEETKRLIIAFENELKLRSAKISFYQISIQKLKSLLQNHNMIQEIANKQENLKRLQEGHYDDLADIENMRSDMEYEKFYLDSIENLSNKLLQSDTLDLANSLKEELEEITRELRDL